MKKLSILISLSFVLASAACGGKGDVDELRKLKEDACACKDKACAEAVNKKLDDKMSKMKEPSKEDADTIAQLMVGAGLCIAKLTE